MATNQQLRNEVSLLINRGDAHEQVSEIDGTSVDYLDIFIRNAERRAYRDNITRTPPFEFRQIHADIEEGTNTFPVPLGYLQTRYVEGVQEDVVRLLTRTSVDNILNRDPNDRVEVADEFAYSSNNFVFRPVSRPLTINHYYYGEQTPIADTTDEEAVNHTLLTTYLDLIRLWAAIEGAMYYGSQELQQMIQVWEAQARNIRNEIISQDRRAKRSGGSLRIGRGHYRNPPKIGVNVGQFGRR